MGVTRPSGAGLGKGLPLRGVGESYPPPAETGGYCRSSRWNGKATRAFAIARGVYLDSAMRVDLTKSSFSVTPRPGPSGTLIQPCSAWIFSMVSS